MLAAAYAPDHLLLHIDVADATHVQDTSGEVIAAFPGAEMTALGNYGIFLLELPAGLDAADALPMALDLPGVKYAEFDWVGEWTATPNDTDYSLMWGLHNTGQTVNGVTGTAGADVSAELAWDVTIGSTNVIAAIVDSGVDYQHPDLVNNMWINSGEIAGNGIDDDGNGFVDDTVGWDFGSGDDDPMDFVGHGTHVAGTVGAQGNNAEGGLGVNWNVSLMALKIGTDLGGPTTSGAIQSINYAVNMGATVSNHSYTVVPTQALQDAITFAGANNHIVVVASGNSSRNIDSAPTFPASYPNDNIISVAATDQFDDLASFSNFGISSVDIGAPGVNIWSTTPLARSAFYGPTYDFSDGTSMASPMVAGAVALLRSIAPDVPYLTIIDALYSGADPLGSLAGRVSTGARLNVANAINQLSPAEIIVNPGTVREDAGISGASLTIRKLSADLASALVVDVSFDDASEVSVPSFLGATSGSILIPAGSQQVTIPIDIEDDTLLDGTQVVTFSMTLAGQEIGTARLLVEDYETINLSVSQNSVNESDGPGAAILTVSRSNTDIFPPDYWVSSDNQLMNYDRAGVPQATIPIEWPNGVRPAGQNARDVIVMENGIIAVLNGSTSGFVSLYNPGSDSWNHIQVPGLTLTTGDGGSGGISSSGRFLYVNDMETGASDPWGLLRIDTLTGTVDRFGTTMLGDRLFTNTWPDGVIYELNPANGSVLKSITVPFTFAGEAGLAFDGTFLWAIHSSRDQLLAIDPDSGTVVDTHVLPGGGTSRFEGLGYLNGRLYLLDPFIDNRIIVYDPLTRSIERTLNVILQNGQRANISGGLTGLPQRNTILVSATFGSEIYEVNPATGRVLNVLDPGEYWDGGLAVVGDELYVGISSGTSGAGPYPNLLVADLNGVAKRTLTTQFFFGLDSLGSDGIQGQVPTTIRYRDVNVGLDGLTYALSSTGLEVGVFDTNNLNPVEFITLNEAVRAIAVADDGTLFAAGFDGDVFEFSRAGGIVNQISTGLASLNDIDLNSSGEIIVSSVLGEFASLDLSLSFVNNLVAPSGFNAFASFSEHPSLSRAQIVVHLDSSDITELTAPITVVLPAGVGSVDVPLDAIDDNIRDGAQLVDITATSSGYAPDSITMSVFDFEAVLIDVVADSLPETAGVHATLVNLTRTDVDGPFEHIEQQPFSNTVPFVIRDNDIVYSQISVPSQVSRVTDIDVTLSLSHGWLSDLDIYLVSPSGTRVELFTDILSNGGSMTATTLDDEAPLSIIRGASPYTGRFMPESPLSAFDGENPSGTWFLEVRDDNLTDDGTVFEWSMNITTAGLSAATVVLVSDDPSEAWPNPVTVTIPANQNQASVWLDIFDDQLLDGTQIATISASSVSNGGVNIDGLELGSDTIEVTDVETISLSVSSSVATEADGPAAVIGTVTRNNTDWGLPLTVSLVSSNPATLMVPVTVQIPAGQASVDFNIDAIDDAVVEGDETVTITASALGYISDVSTDIEVSDVEPKVAISSASGNTLPENSGNVTFTVSRVDQADISQPMVVTLSSSDTSELTVPATVTIPGGAASVPFTVTFVDDNIDDGTIPVTISASGPGIASGQMVVNVADHETVTLTVSKLQFLENSGVGAAVGTVTRSDIDSANALVVSLSSSDLSEVTVPSSVTIPAGQASVNFNITAVNDSDLDGPQLVSISVSAVNYITNSVQVTVLDHEPPVISGPAALTEEARPVITWNALPGASRYDVWIDNLTTGVRQIIRKENVIGTSFQPTESLGIATYQVWVRAFDNLERPGFWSVPYRFRVDSRPTITAPSSGSGRATPSFPTISWTAIPDAAHYDLWLDSVTGGQSQLVRRTDLTTTSFSMTAPLASGKYRVWVRGINSVGEAGKWSYGSLFTVLDAPTIVAPQGGTFDRTPTFTWQAVAGSTHYDLWVQDAKTGTIQIRNQFVTGTSFTAQRDLPKGDYHVWVRAFSDSVYGNWSAGRSFGIEQAPTITSPFEGGTAGARPQFLWNSVSDAARYELWVNGTVNGVTSRVILQTDLTTTSFTPTSNLAAGTYRVWVRAVSNMGVVTDWSKAVNFTVARQDAPDTSGEGNNGFDDALLAALQSESPLTLIPSLDGSEQRKAGEQQHPVPAEDLVLTIAQTHDSRADRQSAHRSPSSMEALAIPAATDSEQSTMEELLQDAVLADWSNANWWAEEVQA